MALIRFGSVIQAASGRLGAICFSRQGGTPIVRTQPLQRNHSSAAAHAVRASFATAEHTWRDLTTAERLTWVNAARQLPSANRLGLSRQISPFCAFLRCAISSLLDGIQISRSADPYPLTLMAHPLTVELSPGGPALVYSATGWFSQYYSLAIHAQRTVRTHPSLPGQLWKVVSRNPPAYYATNIWTQLTASFGTPVALEWYRFKLIQQFHSWPAPRITQCHVQIPNIGPELIYNGDFQTGSTPPPGWDVIGTGQLVQTSSLTWADLKSGEWICSALTANSYWQTTAAHRFTLTGGQSYTLSWAYRRGSGNISGVRIIGTGMTTIDLYAALPGATGIWIRDQKSFTPDANATNCLFRVFNYTGVDVDLRVDNISIRKDTP